MALYNINQPFWVPPWLWKPPYSIGNVYPLVNVCITMENHHSWWANQLFLWPCSIAFCSRLPGGISYYNPVIHPYWPIVKPLNHHDKSPVVVVKFPLVYQRMKPWLLFSPWLCKTWRPIIQVIQATGADVVVKESVPSRKERAPTFPMHP